MTLTEQQCFENIFKDFGFVSYTTVLEYKEILLQSAFVSRSKQLYEEEYFYYDGEFTFANIYDLSNVDLQSIEKSGKYNSPYVIQSIDKYKIYDSYKKYYSGPHDGPGIYTTCSSINIKELLSCINRSGKKSTHIILFNHNNYGSADYDFYYNFKDAKVYKI